jgi:glycine/D-amino acid oxidase-like deaminating enzyme
LSVRIEPDRSCRLPARTHFSADVKVTPYWWETAPLAEIPDTFVPKRVDVAIVGAGYAGLSAAITTSEAGLDTLILEAKSPGEGASTRNGGAVGETLRISYSTMEGQWGRERASAFYLAVREARIYLEHLIESGGIACHYERVGRFIGAHKAEDYESLARDLEVRRNAIGFDAEMVSASDVHRVIGSDAYCGGRLINTDGNLQPALFHQGLVRRALAAGVRLVANTPVTGYHKDGAGFRISTARGEVIARHLVVATNGYTGSLSPWLARRIIPIQSQIIATEPLPAATIERLIPKRRQLGDTRKLHNYFRTSPDGTRILFGGRAGATETEDRLRSATSLRAQMVDVFPELAKVRITHAWAGFIAYTFDSLQHMAMDDGVHYVGGCCGSGVALQPYLGHKTGLKILGRKEAETPFDRIARTIPGYTGWPWFMPIVLFYYGVRDRFRV